MDANLGVRVRLARIVKCTLTVTYYYCLKYVYSLYRQYM